MLHIDFETRGTADLRKTGADRYAADPNTSVWCMAWALDDDPVELWTPGSREPAKLLEHIETGGMVAGWNVAFELAIWTHVIPRICPDWPALKVEQLDDTMARSYARACPGALHEAAKAVGIPLQKDMAGHRLMLKYCKPTIKWKRTEEGEPEWYGDEDELQRLYAYCKQDVEVERALAKRLAPLSKRERKIWLIDRAINNRGVLVHTERVQQALKITDQEKHRLTKELQELTDGHVKSANNVPSMLTWLRAHGLEIDNLKRRRVSRLLKIDKIQLSTDPDIIKAKRVLEIRLEVSKASTAKLKSMLVSQDDDGRCRGLFSYHTATTGRWCLTGDHEVLTPRGWQRLDALASNRIMCWSEDGRMAFETMQPNAFTYKGPLVSITGRRLNQTSTPDHRMPVSGVGGGKTVDNLKPRDPLPRTGCTTSCSSRYSEAQIRFFVMLQADGHYSKDETITFNFSKARKITRCRQILKWLGVNFNEVRWKQTTKLVIPRREIKAWMWSLGSNKTFPWELLYCDHDIFFEELEVWDAYRCGPGSIQYSTTDRHNADFVQAKAHISGRACNVLVKGGAARRAKNWSDAFICNIWLKPGTAEIRNHDVATVEFSGEVFCPETPTGYFLVRRGHAAWITGNSGRRVQLQNFPRPDGRFDDDKIGQQEIDGCLETFGHPHAVDAIRFCYGDPMRAVSNCLRGLIVPEPGKQFIGGDFTGIENRTLMWLAGEEWMLEEFRKFDAGQGVDNYKLTYSKAFNIPVAAVSGQQRLIGKVASLACGYAGAVGAFLGMGDNYDNFVPGDVGRAVKATSDPDTWEETAAKYPKDEKWRFGLDLEAWTGIKIVVEAWRAAHPNVVQFWWSLGDCALEAVLEPGRVTVVKGGKIKFCANNGFLFMQLPSGRMLAYARPSVDEVPNMSGDGTRKVVKYYGVGKKSKRWEQRVLTPQIMSENAASGVARDVLTDAMIRLEEANYPISLHVHDETVSEVPIGFGSVAEYQHLLCASKPWLAGLPVAAKAWSGDKFRK